MGEHRELKRPGRMIDSVRKREKDFVIVLLLGMTERRELE
jgi:hypothetical protein